MPRKALLRQWEDVVRASNRVEARTLNRAVQRGELQRIAPSLYVPSGPPKEVEERIRRNWQRIAAALVPDAVVSHLSAFIGGITEAQLLTLSHPTRFNLSIAVPGLKLVVLRGPGNLPGDMKLGEQSLYWSSRPRVVLENLSRTTEREPRTAGRERVEELLVDILAASGEEVLSPSSKAIFRISSREPGSLSKKRKASHFKIVLWKHDRRTRTTSSVCSSSL